MGFVMMASVLWLLWVYAAQTGTPALFMILFSLFFWAIAGWLIGRFMTPVSPVIAKRVSFAISCALILTALYLPFEAQKFATPPLLAETNDIAWEPFSKERLTQLRKEGTPVFIDFTAKWCLICQVNHLFLSQEGIQKEFAEKNVVLMKADFTQKDPEIGQEIAKWGRGGVPLYLLLWGDEKSEQSNILPQLLTSSIIHEALEPL
jgi:thiol:disulfide interchange protein